VQCNISVQNTGVDRLTGKGNLNNEERQIPQKAVGQCIQKFPD